MSRSVLARPLPAVAAHSSVKPRPAIPCPHCRRHSPAWPSTDAAGEPVQLCSACGGFWKLSGTALDFCGACSLLVPATRGAHRCRTTLVDSAALDLDLALREQLERRFAIIQSEALGKYMRAVSEQICPAAPLAVTMIDRGEPLVACLPEQHLVISLGLLAALEDQAQLAFVLLRELAIAASGLTRRRFALAPSRGPWWKRGQSRAEALALRLDLTLRLGYGAQVEGQADATALLALIEQGFDSGAAPRALRQLERATLHGDALRFLFAAARARQLSTAAIGAPSGILNREVYRRVINGFAVFAAHQESSFGGR